MVRVLATHINGLKLGMEIVFQRLTVAGVIAKKIGNVLSSAALRFKSPRVGNAMGTASSSVAILNQFTQPILIWGRCIR